MVTLPPAGPVSATASTVTASPTSVLANGTSTSTITVSLLDSIGVPVTNKSVTLANTSGPQAATITPAGTQTTDTNGQVTFTVKSSTVGTEVFTATDATDSLVINQTANVVFAPLIGDASVSTVVASPTNVVANGIATSTITVTIKSTGGSPMANKSVTLGGSSGIATISPSGAQMTGVNGQVTFTATATTPGTVVFTATNTTDSQVINQTGSVVFVPATGDASVSTVVASPTNVIANGISTATITVTVKNSGGLPLVNKSVTLGGSPGIATISPSGAQMTGANGQVTFTASSTSAGTVVFTATNTTDSQVLNQTANVQFFNYAQWSNSAAFYVLTTTNGANLPASASETNFPILLRLNANSFNFSQAQTNGADIRFTTALTNTLPYEIEQWDAVNGTASIWVQVPGIQGNTNQQFLMFWGNPNVTSQSSGPSVFNSTNGYSCVMHMNGVADSVGAVTLANVGTTATNGVAGPARHFVPGQGITGGVNIATFPNGNAPHTTEVWFRAGASGNNLLGWGIEPGSGGKVIMQLGSPPKMVMDTHFGANPTAASTLALSQWYHAAYTYSNGTAKIYVNGVLDGSTTGSMNITNVARLYIAGWYDTYTFTGDLDEVRINSLARSSNWLWLEYQNQNPLQTLVGNLVQSGNTFSVSTTNVIMNEGTTTNLTAQAGGAAKVYWLLKQNNQSTVIAVDQFSCALAAGRVVGNQSYVIQFKAVYPDNSVKTNDISVTVLDTIPDPAFTLATSTNLWDGRQTMTVTPVISNWAALVAAGATNFNYNWNVAGVAVIKTITPGMLSLLRSQGSGPMTVTLLLNNGGVLVTNSVAVTVQEPVSDAWVVRTPAANEVPTNGQFYARDDTGFGTVYCNGTVGGSPNSVFLQVYTNGPSGDVLYTNISQAPSGGAFALAARIPAGLVTYSVKWGTVTGSTTNILGTASNIICGDAYIIEGQSNAVTSQVNDDGSTNQWIRSYGASGGWGYGVPHGGSWSLGYWGWDLATNLVTTYSIPICIINGAVGGTRIDQHQANPANHFAPYGPFGDTIYANLLTRVVGAKLTHGICGVLWHQGEQDQGAGGPDGDYDYKFYQQYFVDMSASWKQDYPNLRYYYIFQIWPNACGDDTANDKLREVQRTLPYIYSNMRIMSTLGIVPGSSCHYSVDGYFQFFNLMGPLVRQDNYGYVPATDITAPDLKQAYFTTTNRNEIALVFSQDVAWNSGSAGLFYLDYVSPAIPGFSGRVASGSASGHVVKLQLTAPSTNQTITYLVGGGWDGNQTNLVYGSNGIAALTFCSIPIAAPAVAVAPPILNSVTPCSGATNGGTVVTLTGSNFLNGASVQFGRSSATAVSVNGPTQITASTPAHAPGAVNVVVVNTNGLAVTNLTAFTYMLPPPPAGLSSVGQVGTNLVMVWAGGANQSCVLLSGTDLTQPLSTWTPVATNAVGQGGVSTNTIPISTGEPQRYYLLSIPYD